MGRPICECHWETDAAAGEGSLCLARVAPVLLDNGPFAGLLESEGQTEWTDASQIPSLDARSRSSCMKRMWPNAANESSS
jgi:hypothetical protein